MLLNTAVGGYGRELMTMVLCVFWCDETSCDFLLVTLSRHPADGGHTGRGPVIARLETD